MNSSRLRTSATMAKGKLSLAVSGVVVLLFLATSSCTAKKTNNHECPPSSCGDIRNISYPFRLKDDPNNCGDPSYELACENNRTLRLSLNSKAYHVLEIDYKSYSIRVVDPVLENANNCSSFPTTLLEYHDIPRAYGGPRIETEIDESIFYERNIAVAFLHCTAPAKSPFYVDILKPCRNHSIPSNFQKAMQNYSYVLFGDGMFGGYDLHVGGLEDSCSISMFGWVSREFDFINFTTLPNVHNGLAKGFALTWYIVHCRSCEKRGGFCYLDTPNNLMICDVVCYIREWNTIRPTLKCLRQILSEYVSFLGEVMPRYRQIGTLIGLCLAGRFLLGILCLLALIIYYKVKRWHLSMYQNIEDFLQGPNNIMPVRYAYSDIKRMTNNFSDKLGEGGFGTVFKGKLRSGPLVAVKILGNSKANGQEFISEVATIGRIHHANVVKLIGFCFQGSKRALVYEFMPNGSLEKHIFPKQTETLSLDCKKVFEIALGVARGINYLHEGCEMQILHFDIKPHNILLDEHFNPKVSDFGLAKLCPTENNIVSLTAARGTLGYMAPELYYQNIGGVSFKADIYSYGMLLLEMAGKRKNLNAHVEQTSQVYFPSWVYDQLSKGNEIKMGEYSADEGKMVKKMILVALWCIQMKPTDRPSMNKVIEMLEGDVELLKIPPTPFQSPEQTPAEDDENDADTADFPLLPADCIDSSDMSIELN